MFLLASASCQADGIERRWGEGELKCVGRPNGYFGFGTQYTQANPYTRGTISGVNDGMGVADLLLGYPDDGGIDSNA